jgi:hypothetical protein
MDQAFTSGTTENAPLLDPVIVRAVFAPERQSSATVALIPTLLRVAALSEMHRTFADPVRTQTQRPPNPRIQDHRETTDFIGADGGTRTLTASRPRDFKSVT